MIEKISPDSMLNALEIEKAMTKRKNKVTVVDDGTKVGVVSVASNTH
jgi:hypothetical protein